ncbi:MAG: hypothetical protein K2Q01_03390, partial [Rickettsiales bacterium]|nr:hypothetical protein [Rickettsiales bacterium]
LADPDCGLGVESVEQLSAVLAKELKDNLDNPDRPKPSAEEVKKQNKKMADEMLYGDPPMLGGVDLKKKKGFTDLIYEQVLDGLSTDEDAKGLDLKKRQIAALGGRDAMLRIVKGEERRDGKSFKDLTPSQRSEMLYNHTHHMVYKGLDDEFGWDTDSLGHYKKKLGAGIGGGFRSEFVPGNPERLDPNSPNYLRYDTDKPLKGLAAAATLPLQIKARQDLYWGRKKDRENFENMTKYLGASDPQTRIEELAIDQFEQRHFDQMPSGRTMSALLIGKPEYRSMVRAIVNKEKQLAALAPGSVEAQKAFAELAEFEAGLLKFRQKATEREVGVQSRLNEMEARKQQTGAFQLRANTVEDHVKGNPTDANVAQIIDINKAMEERTKGYTDALDAHVKTLGEGYMVALAVIKNTKPANVEDLQKILHAQALVEAYQLQEMAIKNTYADEMQAFYVLLQPLYNKLPDGANASEGVRKAAAERQAKAMDDP